MAEETQQILIRFRGICAHLDLPNGANGSPNRKKKRTVLVRHRASGIGATIEPHIPYIEFYADDVLSFSETLKVVRYTRLGVDGTLARVDLDEGTEIRLKDNDPDYVEEGPSYRRNVPHMSEIVGQEPAEVAPRLLVPKAGDIKDDRKDDRVLGAVFDMPGGTLVGGEPEPNITRFENKIPFTPRRLARWSDLYATIKSGPVVVQLTPVGGGATREIQFKEDLRMLTIGNEPERLILGLVAEAPSVSHTNHGGFSDPEIAFQPSGHYVLYYNLLKTLPDDRPVPIPTLLGGTGCPNNNYP